MLVGFSFSPGGLLLPYHLGVLASLSYHGHITNQTPLAGSSAGAIAVAAHACGVGSEALDAAMRISSKCSPDFVAKGRLLPSLHEELDSILGVTAHHTVNEREGMVGLAYRELFPQNRPILQTEFDTRDSLIDAVCDSSMFPYFTSNRPFRVYHRDNVGEERIISNNQSFLDEEEMKMKNGQNQRFSPRRRRQWRRWGQVMPRATVDGAFAAPFHQFGCPDFRQALPRRPRRRRGYFRRQGGSVSSSSSSSSSSSVETSTIERNRRNGSDRFYKESDEKPTKVDRTVRVLVFPHELVNLSPFDDRKDVISPRLQHWNVLGQVTRLGLMATMKSSSHELKNLYKEGWNDAKRWSDGEN